MVSPYGVRTDRRSMTMMMSTDSLCRQTQAMERESNIMHEHQQTLQQEADKLEHH